MTKRRRSSRQAGNRDSSSGSHTQAPSAEAVGSSPSNTASLITMPAEILSEIMQNVGNFKDITSLASSCKELNSVWIAHSGFIIWVIGRCEVLCFNDALMAVRATQIVEQAAKNQSLPPDPFPIAELGVLSRKPSVQEYQDMLKLRYQVDSLVGHYDCEMGWRLNETLSMCSSCMPKRWTVGLESSPDEIRDWEVILHRSFYRIFLIGAVLSRHYQEPFFDVTGAPPKFIESLTKHLPSGPIPPLRESDIQYLEKFPVYKMMEYEGLEKAFGPLVSWMAEESIHRLRSVNRASQPETKLHKPDTDILDSEQHALLQDTLYLFGAFLFLVTHSDLIWNDRLKNPTVEFDKRRARLLKNWGTDNREMTSVVWMDYYQLGQIFSPPTLDPDEWEEFGVVLEQQVVLQKQGRYIRPNTRVSPSQNISGILDALYKRGNRPNHLNGKRSPPLNMQLFSFILRKRFNLRFSDDFFEADYDESGFSWFDQKFIDPFCRTTTADTIRLVSADEIAVVTYSEIQ